jgi:quercetin dioxygenase-like cupin family protein
MEEATHRTASASAQAPGKHFNARAQLGSLVPTEGYRVLGNHQSGVPSMVGVIRVTKARNPNAWERHDHGDEVLVLLSGACTMTLRDGEGRITERSLSPGDVLIVPSGVAHHATLHTDEIQALFVTPGSGTKEWSDDDSAQEVTR